MLTHRKLFKKMMVCRGVLCLIKICQHYMQCEFMKKWENVGEIMRKQKCFLHSDMIDTLNFIFLQ